MLDKLAKLNTPGPRKTTVDMDVLREVAGRKGSGKTLTFNVPHVLKAVQMMHRQGYVSRASFCAGLGIGQGAAKTLVRHLREAGIVRSVRAGTHLTEPGSRMAADIKEAMPAESALPPSEMTGGEAGHAVLVRGCAGAVKSGVEQRDMAILYGASAAITLVYSGGAFSFPGGGRDALEWLPGVLGALNVAPAEGDVLIIASAATEIEAEMSAKNAALQTAFT